MELEDFGLPFLKPSESATLVLALATLYWLVVYTRAAQETTGAAVNAAAAGFEQAEAAQKPCLVVRFFTGDGTVSEMNQGRVGFANIGNGPALRVEYEVVEDSSVVDSGSEISTARDHTLRSNATSFLVYGRDNEKVIKVLSQGKTTIVTASYQSMSGRRYRTSVKLTFSGTLWKISEAEFRST